MSPSLVQIVILALIQGAAELLPVSSSAHVIMAEKLMKLDPSSPQMTFTLILLHTGTMAAVIVYFWKTWARQFAPGQTHRGKALVEIAVATLATLAVGGAIKLVIEKALSHDGHKGEIEELFSSVPLICAALAVAGILILVAGLREGKRRAEGAIDARRSVIVGIVQGLCVPFRGLSRSGATISAGMICGVERRRAEEFSFALAVVLTPIAIAAEGLRLVKAHTSGSELVHAAAPAVAGMFFSFLAGLGALRWLSRWLESGRWSLFGIYCLAAAVAFFSLGVVGF